MKTLLKHTIPLLVVIIWMVLAVIIFLASCTKDSPLSVSGPQAQTPEVNKIFAFGDAVDLSLKAYSNIDPAATYELTVDRKLFGRFRIQQNENMNWHLDQLNAGTHRINIYVGVTNAATSSFHFQFSIKDNGDLQSITATRIDQSNYGFDLVMEK